MTECFQPPNPIRMSWDVAHFLGASPCPVGDRGLPQVNFADEFFVWTLEGWMWRWPVVRVGTRDAKPTPGPRRRRDRMA